MGTDDLDILRAAKALAAVGFRVLPIRPGSKLPAVSADDARADVAGLEALFAAVPGAGVGVAVGPRDALLVVDLDRRAGGARSKAWFERWLGALPATVTAVTPDGEHLYYRWSTPYQRLELLPGLAIVGPPVPGSPDRDPAWGRAAGWVVAPPSLHPSGRRYTWAPGRSPFEHALAPLPDSLAALAVRTADGSAVQRWLNDRSHRGQRLVSRLARLVPQRLRQTARVVVMSLLARR